MVRDATADDWPAIWPIYAQIVRAADTFCYDPAIGEDAAREMWMVRPPGRTTAALARSPASRRLSHRGSPTGK
jgi:hypothetical protein